MHSPPPEKHKGDESDQQQNQNPWLRYGDNMCWWWRRGPRRDSRGARRQENTRIIFDGRRRGGYVDGRHVDTRNLGHRDVRRNIARGLDVRDLRVQGRVYLLNAWFVQQN